MLVYCFRCSIDLLNAAVLWHAVLYAALIVCAAGCSSPADTSTPLPCSFALSPIKAAHAAAGGKGSLMITTSADCSWTAESEADWVTVTGGSSGRGSGTVTYRVAANTTASARNALIEVEYAHGRRASALHHIRQASSTWLPLKGAYTFVMEVDPDGMCGWPETKFYWPVSIKITSYEEGTTLGSIGFPPTPVFPANTWSISAGPTRTKLVPHQESPGPAAGAYDVVVDGGIWEAGGLVRARDGRWQIINGTASGARLILTLRDSDKQWECQSDVKWSLLIRFVDLD